MGVKKYKKGIYIRAIQFANTEPAHIQDIINFVGLPISVDYTNEGIRLRVIKGSLHVLVVALGDYIAMYEDGTLGLILEDEFDYEEVEE